MVAAWLGLATIAWPEELPLQVGPQVARLFIEPVAINPSDPRRRRVGGLLYENGWVLTSDNRRFGGISAMHVADGQVTALSDTGLLYRFAVPGGAAVGRVTIDPLPEGPGPATRKSNRDSESLAIHDGQMWVGYEKHNAIFRYRLSDLRAEAAARPRQMRRWKAQTGAEAMVRLPDGRFLVLEEGREDGAPFSRALLFAGDPAVRGMAAIEMRYRRPEGFRVTDAALLPDGRLLLLNRRATLWDWLTARVTIAEIGDLHAGGIIESREIATLRAPLTVDNMEALSVTREAGQTIVWLASDDNFLPIERTLLLRFRLLE